MPWTAEPRSSGRSLARGAKADFIYLGDRGIIGNGHMMMLEKNSDALAEQAVPWIENG
jgi:hypothetical protein